jgi:hypothetical protein
MLLLKLLVPIAGYAVVWLQIHLAHTKPWRDRRTRRHRIGLGALRYVIVPVAILGTLLLVFIDHRDARQYADSLTRVEGLLQEVAAATGAADATGPAILAAVSDLQTRVADQERQMAAQASELDEAQDVLDRQGEEVSKLREAARPRSLSAAAREVLVRELAKGPSRLTLSVLVSDPEADAYARQIQNALEAAGWTVDRAQAIFTPPLQGLALRVGATRVPRGSPPQTLHEALSAAGIPFTASTDVSLGEAEATLAVGHK